MSEPTVTLSEAEYRRLVEERQSALADRQAALQVTRGQRMQITDLQREAATLRAALRELYTAVDEMVIRSEGQLPQYLRMENALDAAEEILGEGAKA